MNKEIVRLGLAFSALGYVAIVGASGSSVVACSSNAPATSGGGSSTASNDSSTDNNTTDDGGSNSTGSGSTTTQSSGSTNVANATCDTGSLLIDDMANMLTDGMSTAGYWYTYTDRTNPVSEPPVIENLADGATPPGSIMPVEGAQFPASVMGPGMIANARECSGGGEFNWGAGFGFDLIDAVPDGGPVVFDACEGGTQLWNNSPDAGSTGIPQPMDASAHKGVSFWMKSNLTSGTTTVNVQFSEKRTSPWGGVCNPCLTTGMTACGDDYLISEIVGSSWKQYTIHWTDLKTQNWTKAALPAKGFDASTWYYLHFQLSTYMKALPNFDLSVACIAFVDQ